MTTFIVFYDVNDEDVAAMGQRRAKELNAQAIGIRDVPKLKSELERLKKEGAKADRFLFYAHGDPGGVHFGLSVLTAGRIASEFSGQGFETVFLPGARVFFPSCDLGAVKAGCESVAQACYLTDNGLVFLIKFAEVFLSRGGRVGATDTTGIGFFPTLFGSTVYHLNYASETTYALASPGGRVRLASGAEIDDIGGTSWKVDVGATSRTYEFRTDGSVARFDEADSSAWSWAPPSQEGASGRWRLERDSLEISWPDGVAESWERPLYTGFQTGASRARGQTRSLYASKRSGAAVW